MKYLPNHVSEEAARWLLRHKEGLTSLQQAEFQRWYDAAPAHQQEYAALCRLWGAMDPLAIPIRSRQVQVTRLICVLLAVLASLGLLHLPKQALLVTAYGECRTQRLADGSTLILGGHSRVRVDYRWTERYLVVEQGMVSIRVAPNPRPLRVQAAAGVLQDIGTIFDVVRSGDHVKVRVQEGLVSLTLPRHVRVQQLAAGQQVRYVGSQVIESASGEEESRFDWQSKIWTFHNLPLGDLLQAVNGQSAQQWRLADTALAYLPLSGSLQRNDRQSLLLMLTTMLPLQAVFLPDGNVVLVNKKNS